MRLIINRVIPLLFLFVLLIPFSAQADNNAVSVEIKGEKAKGERLSSLFLCCNFFCLKESKSCAGWTNYLIESYRN